MGSATLRHGVTNSFTAEAHVEGDPTAALIELGGDLGVPHVGAFHGAGAASTSAGHTGLRGTLGYDYFSLTGKFSAFTSIDAQSAFFETVGRPAMGEGVTLTGGLRFRAGKLGSFSTAFINRKDALQPTVTVLSGGYSRPLAGGFFNASVTRDMHTRAMGAAFYFTGLLSSRRGFDAQGSAGTAGHTQRVVFHQSLPDGGYGPGFDVGYGQSPNAELDATLFERTRFGDGLFGIERSSGQSGFTASQFLWHGAVALLDGRLHATREIGGSYGLIRIPGFSNVRVYLDAGLIGTTDAHGDLFVENFSPYINNYITVDARDVPLSVTVDSLTAKVVPYARNAAIVRFKFRRDGGVLLNAVDAKGSPLPFGTVLTATSGESWSVAQDGAAYLTGVPPGPLMLAAKSSRGTCTLLVTVPTDTSDIPNVGRHTCNSADPPSSVAGTGNATAITGGDAQRAPSAGPAPSAKPATSTSVPGTLFEPGLDLRKGYRFWRSTENAAESPRVERTPRTPARLQAATNGRRAVTVIGHVRAKRRHHVLSSTVVKLSATVRASSQQTFAVFARHRDGARRLPGLMRR